MTEESDSSTKGQKSRYGKHTHDFLTESSVSAITYVFMNPSSSVFRRVLWLFVLIFSTGALLYVLYDRFYALVQEPTSTAVSFYQSADQDFPAVTVCSNNVVRNSTYTGEDFLFVKALLVNPDPAECDAALNSSQRPIGFTDNFQDMIVNGGHRLEDLVVECTFMGRACNRSDAVVTPTPLGACYTFNSGRNGEVFKARGTGDLTGLSLTIDVERDDYFHTINDDVGVKVSIHPQGEPPRPDEQGISVGVGHKAYIGLSKTITVDESSFRNCSNGEETGRWNYLQELDYSTSACLLDCLYTASSDRCGCNEYAEFYTPDVSEYIDRPSCTLDDVCCERRAYRDPTLRDPQLCDCPLPCTFDSYEKTISYSTFPDPARAELFGDLDSQFTSSYVKSNFLSVNVFFETLTVEQRITSDAYTWPSLIADIGGQLGLFLGFTALTFVEVLLWIGDLVRNRITLCCGKNCKMGKHVNNTHPATERDAECEMTTFLTTDTEMK